MSDPIQSPEVTDPECVDCHHQHRGQQPCTRLMYGYYCGCPVYIVPPQPEERTECEITTQWQCPFCKAEQEVGGVATGWMECSVCGRDAWLDPA